MLRSGLEVKLWRNTTFRTYMAAILKTCHTYNFYFIIIGFPDPENMGVDTKIVFLNGLEAKILPKTQLFNDCLVAILFCPLKNSSRMPSWHIWSEPSVPRISTSVSVCINWHVFGCGYAGQSVMRRVGRRHDIEMCQCLMKAG